MSKTNEYVRVDRGCEIDRSDEKWLHPLLRQQTGISEGGIIKDWFDIHKTLEERRGIAQSGVEPYVEFFKQQVDTDEVRAQGDWKEYTIQGGCEEEPDAPEIRVLVRMPKDAEGKKLPAVMHIGGGALAYSLPECWMSMIYDISKECNAVVVSPRYRPALEAQYPAAINDLHAAYAWMIEHAEELNIDSDKIALAGNSSGGHLATALSFRLKRYGYAPRGCVVTMPITDDRMDKPSSRYFTTDGEWDGPAVHLSACQWLGAENVASPMIGPEAFANHATVEECKGLCPMLITTAEMDPDSDYCTEFVKKLKEAGGFVDYHLWGGTTHSKGGGINEDSKKFQSKVDRVFYQGIKDCLENDLRRPWL